jgi:Zn-finger nucleic acid-binding protein
MSVLNCPVCQGAMREINKNGILIDTCTQCRGVWLDRGELEKLSSMVGAPPEPSGFMPVAQDRGNQDRGYRPEPRRKRDDEDDDDDRRDRGYGGYGHSNAPRKKSSFLDFFD